MEIPRLSTQIYKDPASLVLSKSGHSARGPSVLVAVEHRLNRPEYWLKRVTLEGELTRRSERLAQERVFIFATDPVKGCRACPLHKIAEAHGIPRICRGMRLTNTPREMRGAWHNGTTYTIPYRVSGLRTNLLHPKKKAHPGEHEQWRALPNALCTNLPTPPPHLTR